MGDGGVPLSDHEMVWDVPAGQVVVLVGEVTVKLTPDVTVKPTVPEVWRSGLTTCTVQLPGSLPAHPESSGLKGRYERFC